MKKIKMVFHGKEYYGKLLTDKAPETIKALEKVCPFESRVGYAKLADREFFFQTPAVYDEVENLSYTQKGHIVFYGSRQSICVFYDDMIPLYSVNQIGIFEGEDLKNLKIEADSIWEKQGDVITVDIIEE